MLKMSTTKGIIQTQKVIIPIPFFANLAATPAAGSGLTLVSAPISSHYKIIEIEAHFRDDTANLVRIGVFSANNRNAPVTTAPNDVNVISSLSPTPFLRGEGEIIKLKCEYTPAPNHKYIKVWFLNQNAYALTAFCVVTIEATLQTTVDAGKTAQLSTEQQIEVGKYQIEAITKVRAVLDAQADFMSGTPEVIKDSMPFWVSNTSKVGNGVFDRYKRLLTATDFVPPEAPLEDRQNFVKNWLDTFTNLQIETKMNFEIVNMLASALHGSSAQWMEFVEEMFGANDVAKQIYQMGLQKGLLKPVENYWNSIYTPNYPSSQELIEMVIKEIISIDTFKRINEYNGIGIDWSQKIWDAHFIQPAYGDMQKAFWRGTIKPEELDRYLKLFDLDPRYNDVIWKPLLEVIPPYQELVNQRVKEVTTQDEFEKGLAYWGFKGIWGKRIWDAHFSPASFEDFLTAMRRKKTVDIPIAGQAPNSHTFGRNEQADIAAIKQLSVLADYDPRYWDFFETRMYNDPSYRMIMWGFETDSIKREQIPDLVHRLGLNPQDESWYTNFLIHFQERPWINKYLTALQTAFINEAITEDELKKRVIAVPRNEDIANWIIKIANIRKEIIAKKKEKPPEKLLSVADFKKAYSTGFIDNVRLRTELQLRGYSDIDIDMLIHVIDNENTAVDLGGKKDGLTIAELFDAFRYSLIDESTLMQNLTLRGMNQLEAQILVNTKKAKWGVEAAS